MPNFVVIDHSITDLGGHHYGYAAHVLRAAERAGYQPVLATNRKFANSAEAPWPTLRVYEFDFWAELEAGRLRRFLRSIADRLFRTWAVFRSRRLYKTRNATADPARRSREEAPPEPKSPHKLVRLLADIYRRTLGHNRSMPPQKMKEAFERDTKILFEEVELGAGDVVFIPTISHRDMLGLLEFFGNGSQGADASWHLLFRRNLPESSVQGDVAPDSALNEIRCAFEIFQREAGSRRIYFYTDSDELTEQYEQFGAFRFRTLPIPHTYAPQERVVNEGPRRITYLGDARREKGYHLLPEIVRNLKKDYLETGKARFVVQSNPNSREGAGETAIPRAELDCFPSSMVVRYDEPLSTGGYKDLLLNSDITLLPYDQTDYRARSSGILAESLAAGIPVIVPAETWLSRQLPPAPHAIDSLSRRPGEAVPLGVVGLAYHEAEEIPNLIREIIDHYSHYRQTATEFAAEWRRFHNADRLVEEIQLDSGNAEAG